VPNDEDDHGPPLGVAAELVLPIDWYEPIESNEAFDVREL
jgi:hypothetical protein